MSTIVLGCDRNGHNDSEYQSTVAKILEKAGHTVEKTAIEPNAFASYSDGSNGKNPKGKIGIYLIAAGTYSIADATYGTSKFKYNYFGIRPECSPNWNVSDFDTKPIGADADCPGWLCSKISGRSFKKINEIVKEKSMVVTGKDATEMGNNLVKAMGGETTSSDSSDSKSDSGSTVKEAVQKLLKHWDGEVECRIVGKKVYINKVREPQSNYSLLLQEGLNIFSDSVKVTDVNPNTVNYLVVKWSEGKITIKDSELIKRFGTIKSEVNAVKKVTKTVTTSKSTTDTDTSSDSEDTSADTETDTDTDITTDSETTTDDAGTTDDSGTKTTVVDVPITKYKDALAFANTEWHKIKRDNGHSLECQTVGSPKWRVGEWVKVVLPSFGINDYMYITRASHSDDGGDWTCNLTLVDYPPGWGVEETNSNSNSNNNSKNKNVSSVINQIVTEISKFSYSSSCSDGNCIKSSKKGDCHALSDYIYTRLKGEGISARIYQYKTSGSDRHRQVEYQDGSKWIMFPYSKSGIDHNFYTNSIPSGAGIYKENKSK